MEKFLVQPQTKVTTGNIGGGGGHRLDTESEMNQVAAIIYSLSAANSDTVSIALDEVAVESRPRKHLEFVVLVESEET